MAVTASEAARVALQDTTSPDPDRARLSGGAAIRRCLMGLREASVSLSVKLHVEVGIRTVHLGGFPRLIGQNCTIVATDVVSFGCSSRTDADRLAIRAGTTAMTEATFKRVWPECGRQDCGDGLVLVIPPDTTTAAVVESLLTVLPAALEQYNSAQEPGAQVQLRVAVHVGPVVADATGMSGDAIIQTARMLNARPFKDAVAAGKPAMGLIASPFVFDTAITNGGLLDEEGGEGWTQVAATVKERHLTAWYHLVKSDALIEGEAGAEEVAAVAGSGVRGRLIGPAALLREGFQAIQGR